MRFLHGRRFEPVARTLDHDAHRSAVKWRGFGEAFASDHDQYLCLRK
jgi:hypothetical protein